MDPSGRFAALLEQLRSSHLAEVTALQDEVAQLRKHVARIADAGASEAEQDMEAFLTPPSAPIIGPSSRSEELNPCSSSLTIQSFSTDCTQNEARRSSTKESVVTQSSENESNLLSRSDCTQNESSGRRQSIVSLFSSQPAQPKGLKALMRSTTANFEIDFGRPLRTITNLVRNSKFEAFFCAMILMNSVAMAIEVEYDGLEIGYQLGYPKMLSPAADLLPGATDTFRISSLLFGSLFALEISMKMIGLGRNFMYDYWNWIDLTIVLFWAAGQMGTVLSINTTMFRLLRLGRLLRIVRLLRMVKGFDSLFIMTTAIGGSISVLVWTFVLLSLVQMLLALFLLQYLHVYFFSSDVHSLEERHAVFTYFGTFVRAYFSMFEITLANWPPAIRLLAVHVGQVFFVLGLLHKLSIGFAVVAVINGVFMQETFKVAAMDDVLMVKQKQRSITLHRQKMKRFLEEADRYDGDGQMSRQEFLDLVENPQVKLWLGSMELDMSDADNLFTLLDVSGEGQLSFEELVSGVTTLKGSARQIDLIMVRREMQRHVILLEQVAQQLQTSLGVGADVCAPSSLEGSCRLPGKMVHFNNLIIHERVLPADSLEV